ncbi:MAG TPA: NADH-quinone oxidoreductase subunit NuoG [Acidimicrobiales bacterium]|nr:NADH-quinone oxidoreductase subunit NuoG [Acidimicrobiales bacterium]
MADPVATSHHAISQPADPDATVTFSLDGREVTAPAGEFLIAAAERAGTFIPRFCYHPRMKPVGMCRMCLVEVSGPRGATLQPACYVTVAEGMEVDTTSEKTKKAQVGVLELLLVNHPLDCPVCDKGGECPLQDQTLGYGPGESRFLEEKRHWAKPIPISELVLLDRERCIQCGRCVRFAAEVAGEAQIDFLGRGDTVEVSVFEDHAFTSYFSGNTVQICPVGALTASPYRFTARPWDLDQVESTCTLCAFGCRAAVQSSANRVTRLLGIDSDPLNHSWLCDKGRFGYEAVNAEDRLTVPLVRGTGERDAAGAALVPASWAEALSTAAARLAQVRAEHGPESIGVIGGARLSNEDAYAWAKLAKSVLGTDSVDAQLADGLPAEVVLGLPRATVDDACRARCVVVLAGDLREELPVLFLRLRGAAVDGGVPVVELAARSGALGEFATASLAYRPGEAAALARAVAAGGERPESVDEGAWEAARGALGRAGDGGEGVVVVLGRPSMAEHAELVAAAAAALAEAWPAARFLPALRRGNVMGAIDMGLAPGLLPGRVGLDEGRHWYTAAWGSVPPARGRDTTGILRALADGTMHALVLVGADPVGDFPDRALAEEALRRAGLVVAVDAFLSSSSALADVVLPTASAHERAGTTTNIEGRVTRVAQKLVAPGQCWPDWMVAVELAERLSADLGFASVAEIWDEVERLAPSHAGITRAALDAPGGRDGIVAPLASSPVRISSRASLAPFDPVATPGIEAVEIQGAPPRAGLAEPLGGDDGNGAGNDDGNGAGHGDGNGAGSAAARPRPLQWPQPVDAPHVPAPDSYSLRLVAPRHLYDGGVFVEACASLAALAPPATVQANPYDLDRLGVTTGERVRVRSARGALVLRAVADDGVPRGVASIGFNLAATAAASDGDGATAGTAGEAAATVFAGASALIDAGDPVVDVRLETL